MVFGKLRPARRAHIAEKPRKERKTVMTYCLEADLANKLEQYTHSKYEISYRKVENVNGLNIFFLTSPSYYLIARCSDDPTEEQQRMLKSLDEHARIRQDPDSINPYFRAIVIYDSINGYKRDLPTNVFETNPETLERDLEAHMQFLLNPLPF